MAGSPRILLKFSGTTVGISRIQIGLTLGILFVYFGIATFFRPATVIQPALVSNAMNLYGDLNCIKRVNRTAEEEEGSHYPNQTFYDEILSKPPEENVDFQTLLTLNSLRNYTKAAVKTGFRWVLIAPKINLSTSVIFLSIIKNIDFHEREQIRNSWGAKNISRIQSNEATVVFLVASDLEDMGCMLEEHRKYGDILMVKIKDSYRGLVYKLLMAYRFISKAYPHCHIVKVDRDVVLDVDQLIKLFDETKTEKFIFGRLWNDIQPSRVENQRWFVPSSVYPNEYYPWYVDGSFYTLSNGSLAEIVKVAPGAMVFELEDAFFTGILRKRASLMITCLPYFQFFPIQYPNSGCSGPFYQRIVGEKITHLQQIQDRFQQLMEFKRNACQQAVLFPHNLTNPN